MIWVLRDSSGGQCGGDFEGERLELGWGVLTKTDDRDETGLPNG